jgi:hypothetical protein
MSAPIVYQSRSGPVPLVAYAVCEEIRGRSNWQSARLLPDFGISPCATHANVSAVFGRTIR